MKKNKTRRGEKHKANKQNYRPTSPSKVMLTKSKKRL